MRNFIIVLLALGLIAPAMTVSAGHYNKANYAAGGSGFSEDHPSTGLMNWDSIIASATGVEAMHTGDIIIKLIDPDTDLEVAPDTIIVNLDDFVTTNVAVYYSFHAGSPSISFLGGAPHNALETGTFCNSAELERPTHDGQHATHLRLSVNVPSLIDADVCPLGLGIATLGVWEAYHPTTGDSVLPSPSHAWTPPWQ